MKGIVWFRSDLRIDDNPALNAALSNCDEVLAIYIFSQSQWEIHNESNIKQEFLFNNLTQLKESLANFNIPLIAINTDSYKTLPQDLSSFAAEHKINHVFCNKEFGFNDLETPSTTTIVRCKSISSVRVSMPNLSVTSNR